MVDWYSIQPLPDSSRKMHISLSHSYQSSKLYGFIAHYLPLLWISKEHLILFVVFSRVTGYGSWGLGYNPCHIFILRILYDRCTSIDLSLLCLFYHKGIRLITSNDLSRKWMFSSCILDNFIVTCKYVPNLTTMEGIQPWARFIQEDNPGISHQSNSNRQSPLHSSRQLFRFKMLTREQINILQRLLHLLVDIFLWYILQTAIEN